MRTSDALLRGCPGMADALDCRIRALHCSEAARGAADARVKDILADMAALWIKLARELERSHTQVDDKVFGLPIRKRRRGGRSRQEVHRDC
jgi:hypothetical protein